MTSLAYGLDVPYEVQLEHHAATSTTNMVILELQRSPGRPITQHLLTPGVYMVSLTYNGEAAATLRHIEGGVTNSIYLPTGTRGVPRTSAPIKISVQGTNEYLRVEAPSTEGPARATISVIPASTFDEMAESTQGVSVLSEISNLKSTKADKSTLDARVPANTALRLDTSVGTRIFAGNTMIYGDTGWRSVEPNTTHWSLDKGNARLHLKRIGDVVELEGRIAASERNIGSTRSPIKELIHIPSGFRSRTTSGTGFPIGQVYSIAGNIGAGKTGTLYFVSSSWLTLAMDDSVTGDWASSDELAVHAIWTTEQSWPSTLPGLPD